MISFFLFLFGIGFSTGSFLLGLYYIQDLPLHSEFIDALHIHLSFPNFGSDINLGIGLFLVLIFPLILFFTWKGYRGLLVREIRKGFWNYLLITILQAFSFYILYRLISFYYIFHILIHVGVLYFLIFFTFLRIGWYQDYHGKKRFFKI